MELSLWWPLLAIGACADRRDALGRVSAEVARRLVTDDDRAWLGYGYGGGGYGSGGGAAAVAGCDGSGSGGSSSSGDGDGDGYGVGSGGRSDGSGDGSGYGCCDGSGSSGRSDGGRSDGIGIVSLTIDGVRRTPDEIRVWLIEMATAEQGAVKAWS